MTNSTIYNGKQSEYTKAAESMLDLAMGEFEQQQDRLQLLEEKINPAANKSTQVRVRGTQVRESRERGRVLSALR